MPIKVGIVGLGAMGVWHAATLRELRGFVLRSVCDITPAQRAVAEQDYGCRAFGELKPFLADPELDLVVVATPSHAHVEPTLAALRAGKHVVCEKPLAQTESDARRMFAAAEGAEKQLLTFQNRRWDSDFLTVARMVRSGRLGELQNIRLLRWFWSDLMQTFGVKSYRPGWRSEAAYGGGALLDFGAHYFDQLLQLLPAPVVDVYGDLRARRWTRDADDQFLAILRTANGVVAQVEFSQNAHPPLQVEWLLSGSQGGFRYDPDGSQYFTHNTRGKARSTPVKNLPSDWRAFYQNVAAVLAGRNPPAVQPRETLRLMRLLDAIRRSAATGKVVAFDDVYAPSTSTSPAPSRQA